MADYKNPIFHASANANASIIISSTNNLLHIWPQEDSLILLAKDISEGFQANLRAPTALCTILSCPPKGDMPLQYRLRPNYSTVTC